jgi:hypothetical protein
MPPKKYFFLFFFLLNVYAFPQTSLYMPLNFQEAYANGTRSYNGKPGPEYWQNNADYRLTAYINPQTRTLTGTANITYYNNSPDTLDQIVIRLYQNINKLGNIHDFPLDESERSDGMVISSLEIDGEKIDLKNDSAAEQTGTNLVVKDMGIPPGEKVKINTSWSFVIAKVNTIRMGAYDPTTFFIGYWYPQVAVYDDIDGWDMTEYTGQVEFYNDFNNYDVNITVPNYMCVWATGTLKNPEIVLAPQILKRYNDALSSDTVINIISKPDYLRKMSLFNISGETNSWHFAATGVPDFAFGISSHYVWDAKSLNTGEKKVFISAVYDPDSAGYNQVCDAASKSIELLSKNLPGVAFPFQSMTVFNSNEGGMEYPMMVNEDFGGKRADMVNTTAHEIAHSYFPFYMGTNERKYAWMDEGWAQMFAEHTQYAIDSSFDARERDVSDYLKLAGQDKETPPMVLSYNEKERAYVNASYERSAAAYNTLKELLGDELFKQALQEYMKRWNGKHPTPYDFFHTCNDAAKEDLSWFWQPWFFEPGYPELSIDTVIIADGRARVLIKQEGNIPTSVQVTFKYTDGTQKTIFKNCGVWRTIDELWLDESLEGKKLKSIELGSNHIPDVNKENNLWEGK